MTMTAVTAANVYTLFFMCQAFVNFLTTLWDKYRYYPHLTDEETEAAALGLSQVSHGVH